MVICELKVFVSCTTNYATLFRSSFDQVLVPDPSPPWVPVITKPKSDKFSSKKVSDDHVVNHSICEVLLSVT